MGGWPCSFYGKKNPMFWLWQIFLKMLEEVWNNLQQNLWFRENDTCMRFSRSSLACATRHKSPTFPVLSCSKRDYIDPSREKSPKPNGKGVQRHANGWKVVPSFLYVHGIKKKRPRQALRLGIKICVIREHRNSLTSFFPPQRTKVMHPLHRNMSDVDVLETVDPENWLGQILHMIFRHAVLVARTHQPSSATVKDGPLANTQ